VAFGANNVDLFAISDNFADERHILEAENRQVAFIDRINTPKSGDTGLVKGPLSEN
jgi:hypothetical protein